MTENKNYDWKYSSVGGVVRVQLQSGEDIAHLGELDQKKWTTLSCPTQGLEFDKKTLDLIDADGDGRIHVNEVVAAAQWLTSVVKHKDNILKGASEMPLDEINTECEEGKKLYDSAKQILANLGLEKDVITVAEASDSVAIFAKTQFNGDGVITPASTSDEALQKVINSAIASFGGVADRSGVDGVDAAKIEQFYAACADYAAWQDAFEADKAAILPFGDNTAAALAACDALKDKIADYFMRCKLINFNEAAAGAVDVSVDRIGAISDKDLSACSAEISTYPLARPAKEGVLPFDAVNPAWQGAFATLKSLVLDVELAGKTSMTEAEWNAILGKFGAYTAWCGAKKGAEVEALGLDYINELLAADGKAALLELVEKDLALKAESESIDAVGKLLLFYRDFYHFLNNFVVFNDFYGRNDEVKAVFEAGKLYIDERCCNLCLKVQGTGNHAEAAGLSGMFLIYCTCTSKKLCKSMDIVAVMTDGSIKSIRPGKNAIFYDLEGNDWDAVITKVVENPLSVKQAFWSPYRKFANTITERINKSAAEKENKVSADMTAKANNVEVTAAGVDSKKVNQAFDIAKFAGIFAAVGMGLGMVGSALMKIINPWYNIFLLLIVLLICISGPSMFIAWQKLRKRNLGPVLNANGWAINSEVLVNILFGGTLTSVAKYPIVKGDDPFQQKTPVWKKILRWFIGIIVVAGIAFFILWKFNKLPWQKVEPVEEAVVEVVEAEAAPAEAEAAEIPAE